MRDAVLRLCKKYAEANKAAKVSEANFAALNDSADPTLVQEWTDQEAEALRNRDVDEAAMDIYDIKIDKGNPVPSIIVTLR